MNNYTAADFGYELWDLYNNFDYSLLDDEDCEYNHDFANDDLYELPF
jgi:hypothetical protein